MYAFVRILLRRGVHDTTLCDKVDLVICGRFIFFNHKEKTYITVRVMVVKATFNNISVISWQSVLLVEEAGNHQPAANY
jgi:hypothetical protein